MPFFGSSDMSLQFCNIPTGIPQKFMLVFLRGDSSRPCSGKWIEDKAGEIGQCKHEPLNQASTKGNRGKFPSGI